jgi:hypothetical protein
MLARQLTGQQLEIMRVVDVVDSGGLTTMCDWSSGGGGGFDLERRVSRW